ncbi:endonuclease/exonuclease/phosphatase family protein [Flavobacterium sp. C4GT6]|uniref:endonuclease/exonuclease/phosphatase family protein n=1 Tax=Flavobacterium sp. C4GT6 TaxID=3103818 RepID=UPI002ED11E2A
MNAFLIIFTVLIILFTIIPLIRNDYWTFRVFDYPRLQKLTLSVICIILIIFYYDSPVIEYAIILSIISLNIIYLLYHILPFTPLSKKQMLTAKRTDKANTINIVIANVYQENRNARGCLTEIKNADPDIVLLIETDNFWADATLQLKETYPYNRLLPLENTYGMILYSKLELKNTEVKYMVEDDIPSIHTKVILQSGEEIQLYALHPTPPVPNENVQSTERDKELLLAADLCKKSKLPVIVMGDLNDVAWSYTTKLFLKMSGMLDPRIGRGFFNTFHAHYPFMRFPLDHAFASPHFKFVYMKRLNNCGSDHFPINVSLQFDKEAQFKQHGEKPDSDDIAEANEKKQKTT